MTLPLDQFWKLAAESQLFEVERLATLRQNFDGFYGGRRQLTGRMAAEWLVKQRELTVYQARILLNGGHGPFQFGEYRLLNPRPVASAPARRFNGLHVGTHHRVLLHFWRDHDDDLWQQAYAQADLARRIRHPNLDRVYETVSTAEYRLIVTEWPEGTSLREMLRQRKRLPVAQSCLLVQQIATGLAHAHALGAVHGQLGLDEVVVQPSGHVKLLRQPIGSPFPIAWDRTPLEYASSVALYWAPEFLQPGTVPDPLTDVYALGCLLYELVAGRPPFHGDSVERVMAQHATERIEPLEEELENVPSGLTEMISFMMAKRRALRYPEMNEVVDKLNVFVPSGVRQTMPRRRATESYYLAQLDHRGMPLPQHLAVTDAQINLSESTLATRTTGPGIVSTDAVERPVDTPSTPMVVVDPSDPRTRLGRVSRKSARRVWMPAIVGATLLLLLFASLRPWRTVPQGRSGATESRDEALVSNATGTEDFPRDSVPTAQGSPPTATETLVEDDGRTLWASPTEGVPIDFSFAPAGAQLFVHVRPQAAAGDGGRRKSIGALGPDFARARQRFEQQLHLQLAEVQRLLMAIRSLDVGQTQMTMLVVVAPEVRRRLREQAEALRVLPRGVLARLGDAAAWFPNTAADHLVLGDRAQLEEISADPAAPPLRRELETLRRVSDVDRQLTILATPNFLAADGRSLFSGPRKIFRQPLLDFFGLSTQAASFSMHLDSGTFVELRWVCPVDTDPRRVAQEGRRQFERIPARVNEYLGGVVIPSYWQPLALRLPLMVQFLGQQMRDGVADRVAILNAYLPPEAAHNLILASELAAASASSSAAPNTSSLELPSSPQGSTIDRILTSEATLIVNQQSVETVMQDFADVVRLQTGNAAFFIRIEGRDLQLEGITRNQQIRNVRLENRTIGQILTQLVVRANPSPVSDPRQPQQKLLWVVAPGETPGVLITTRTAAREKGYRLPVDFVAETPDGGLQ